MKGTCRFSSCLFVVVGAIAAPDAIHAITTTLEEKRYASLPPTVFAPGGRLLTVERTARSASDSDDICSPLVVAIRCQHGNIVVLSSRPRSPHVFYNDDNDDHTPDKIPRDDDDKKEDGDAPDMPTERRPFYASLLMEEDMDWCEEPSSPSPVSILSPTLVAAVGGNAVDSAILLQRIRQLALQLHANNDGGASFLLRYGGACGVESGELARRLADRIQGPTQSLVDKSGRMLATSALLIGTSTTNKSNVHYSPSRDDSTTMWRVDPTGQFWNCDAAAVGRGAGTSEATILRHVWDWTRRPEEDDDDNERVSNENEEEDDLDRLSTLVTNQQVRDCLSSLSSQEAVQLGLRCMTKSLQWKKKGTKYFGVNGFLFTSGGEDGKRTGGDLQVISTKQLQQRLSLILLTES